MEQNRSFPLLVSGVLFLVSRSTLRVLLVSRRPTTRTRVGESSGVYTILVRVDLCSRRDEVLLGVRDDEMERHPKSTSVGRFRPFYRSRIRG